MNDCCPACGRPWPTSPHNLKVGDRVYNSAGRGNKGIVTKVDLDFTVYVHFDQPGGNGPSFDGIYDVDWFKKYDLKKIDSNEL